MIRQALLRRRGHARLEKSKEGPALKQIIGEGPALLQQLRRVPRFARCDATVLISGESGTGKEIFARAIHSLSPRASLPFVPVNCGAIPEHLMESEIFGYKPGAFHGAVSDQHGRIHESEGGTLFLDEVDGLTCYAQVKLLRFLQEGEYRPVGSQKMVHANVRVVAAANANFGQIVQEGKFREDLFYRLNVLNLLSLPLENGVPIFRCSFGTFWTSRHRSPTNRPSVSRSPRLTACLPIRGRGTSGNFKTCSPEPSSCRIIP